MDKYICIYVILPIFSCSWLCLIRKTKILVVMETTYSNVTKHGKFAKYKHFTKSPPWNHFV